jgi:hypothetical protein
MTCDQSGLAYPPPAFWRSRYFVALLVLSGFGLVLLLSEHRAHLVGALPMLFLLACPLMHLFMHRGHGGHGREAGHGQRNEGASPTDGERP